MRMLRFAVMLGFLFAPAVTYADDPGVPDGGTGGVSQPAPTGPDGGVSPDGICSLGGC